MFCKYDDIPSPVFPLHAAVRHSLSDHSGDGKHQAGSVLLEALFAILVFSMGILAIVGLQVASIKQSTAAQYRNDASLLASELVGQMWVSDRTTATLQSNFNTGGPVYTTWLADVQATLPGAAANPPTVVVESVAGGGSSATTSKATVTVSWKAPNEAASVPVHSYTLITQIR